MTDAYPPWLDRKAYPFRPHFLETPQGRLHYVDEGDGDPILFVHGNPTWSFEHRRLIQYLSQRYRCIALDHIGFGLSDKPPTYNSWFWPVRGVKAFERFSAFLGGPIGCFLCRNFNFFPRVMMRIAVGDKRSLPPHVHRQFTCVHRTRGSRKDTWVFPGAIIGQSDWLEGIWRQRDRVAHLPLLLLWGMKDVAMDAVQLAVGSLPSRTMRHIASKGSLDRLDSHRIRWRSADAY